MGQKVNPKGIRIGITRGWKNKWFGTKKDFAKFYLQDLKIEDFVKEKINNEGLSRIEIVRTKGKIVLNIFTAKPGLVIGRGGEGVETLKNQLKKEFNKTFDVNIKEVKKPYKDARIVAGMIASQIEKRVSYRRAAKMSISKIMESGAKGVKIYLGGRLNGVEISRGEFFSEGKIPLHTFRADIDYASEPAKTTYGQIGVKVWIYRGDVFKKDLEQKTLQEMQESKQ